MPVANKIQYSELRAKLTELGSNITLPALNYPDADDITPALQQFLEAVTQCQIAQNAFAAAGEDVAIITKASGATTSVEYPAGSGDFFSVVPTVYSASLQLVNTVSNVLPPLV